jgi:hypothetical protein
LRNHRDKLDAVVEAVSMIGDRRRPVGDDVLLSNDDQYLLVQLCTPLVGLSDELAAFCEQRAAAG